MSGKPDDIPQNVWEKALHQSAEVGKAILRPDARQEDLDLPVIIARAIMAERDYAEELRTILTEILDALRKDAPGTPLNNRKYDQLGIRAYAAIRKRGEA